MSASVSASTGTYSAIPVACDFGAIAEDERAEHMALVKHLLFEACQERQELPDGVAWRFAADQLGDLSRYIENESRCCPFFTFTLEVTPQRGAIWLRLTGNAEVKAFLLSEMQTITEDAS